MAWPCKSARKESFIGITSFGGQLICLFLIGGGICFKEKHGNTCDSSIFQSIFLSIPHERLQMGLVHVPARSRVVGPCYVISLPTFRLCAVPSGVKAKMGEDPKPKRVEDDSPDYFLHFKYNPCILANVSIQSGSRSRRKPHVFLFIYPA